eukprot:scaffold2575_cov363-Prasinococcus_capsulatus_cf.AAC.1
MLATSPDTKQVGPSTAPDATICSVCISDKPRTPNEIVHICLGHAAYPRLDAMARKDLLPHYQIKGVKPTCSTCCFAKMREAPSDTEAEFSFWQMLDSAHDV